MVSGNLDFLEPSGPLRACDGTALPLLHIVVDEDGVNLVDEEINSLKNNREIGL